MALHAAARRRPVRRCRVIRRILNVLPLAGVKDDIDTQLVPLEASIASRARGVG